MNNATTIKILDEVFGPHFEVPEFFYSHDGDFKWTWPKTGMLLERLPEWEEVEEFLIYHKIPTVPVETGSTLYRMVLPLHWLTSPSILPEKVGEYIKWRELLGVR